MIDVEITSSIHKEIIIDYANYIDLVSWKRNPV